MKKIQHVFKHQHFIEADKTLVQHSYFYKLKRRTHCHKYLQNLSTVLLSIKAGVPILFFPVLLPLKIKQCKASPNDFTAETTTAKTYSHSQRNILTASRARLERDWVSCAWKHKPGIYIPPWWNNRGNRLHGWGLTGLSGSVSDKLVHVSYLQKLFFSWKRGRV